MSSISEAWTFARRFVQNPREVGTPFACSDAVAQKILDFVPTPSELAHRYLEVGPGAESFLARKLGPNDQLDLVEIDQVFCEVLREKYKDRPNIHVHHMPIQDWRPEYQYDVVAGFVPLNALPTKEIVQPVLHSYRRLTKKDGVLLGVEYIGTSTLKGLILFGDEREAFGEVVALKKEFFEKCAADKVWKNLPPARVMNCRG